MAAIDASSSTSKQHHTALMLALGGALLFSTKPILIKWLYSQGVDVLPMMWLRMLLSLPFYLIMGALAWRKLDQPVSMKLVLQAAMVGLLGYYLASLLDLMGLQYVSAQLERLLLYAYPTLVVILGALLFGHVFRITMLIPMLLTYAGLALMFGQDLTFLNVDSHRDLTRGTMLVLGSAVAFALYLLYSKPYIVKLGSVLFTAVAMTSATVATAVHYGIHAESNTSLFALPEYSLEIWLGMVGLAVFATVLPSFLVSEAIKHLGAATTSLTGTLGPVATTVLAIIFLNEPFSLPGAVGMAMVIGGVWILSRMRSS